ncbi:hypothetical protein MMC09_001440 [Bachmanniomyces sp. S44760]|nr:hypothetical protein [Bachmanniomyces sp. S44760]
MGSLFTQKGYWTIALAVASIYAVDFAINAGKPVYSTSIFLQELDSRHPTHLEATARICLGMTAVGHLIGYGAGTMDLLKIFGTTLGDTQFKQLTVIAAAALIFAVGVTSYAVQERVLISSRDSDKKSGAIEMVSKILKTTLHLPARIQGICWIQFWAWIGWFPFLFYSTTWVGETYFRYSAPHSAKESSDTLGDIGRVGSLSLVVFSIITFAGSVALPWIVKSPEDEKRGFTPRPPPSIAPLVTTLQKFKPDLLTAWMYGHLIFAGAMSLAPFVRSLRFATILVSICGIPWALACWAPFAFMGIEINRLTAPPVLSANGTASYRRLSNSRPSSDDMDLNYVETPPHSPTLLRLNHERSLSSSSLSANETGTTGETAGIYLGILNLFTTLPQFVGTAISMLVFSILEPGKSPELHEEGVPEDAGGVNAISVCLFIGAISALGAAWATRKLEGGR